MASEVWGVPVFSFFAVYDHGISPSTKLIGDITSLDAFAALVPAAATRVEMNRTPGKEEVRVVKNANGAYHTTTSQALAQKVITELDRQTSELFEYDVKAYPDAFTANLGEEKHNDQSRHIIRYDEQGKRILPGIRHAGYLTTLAEYDAMEGGAVCWYEDPDFVGVTDTATGDVWWATETVKQEVLARAAERDDGDMACGSHADSPSSQTPAAEVTA